MGENLKYYAGHKGFRSWVTIFLVVWFLPKSPASLPAVWTCMWVSSPLEPFALDFPQVANFLLQLFTFAGHLSVLRDPAQRSSVVASLHGTPCPGPNQKHPVFVLVLKQPPEYTRCDLLSMLSGSAWNKCSFCGQWRALGRGKHGLVLQDHLTELILLLGLLFVRMKTTLWIFFLLGTGTIHSTLLQRLEGRLMEA